MTRIVSCMEKGQVEIPRHFVLHCQAFAIGSHDIAASTN